MLPQLPTSAEELRDALAQAAAAKRSIRLFGGDSKRPMAGPIHGDEAISTAAMQKLIRYEPRDLTISVEAGMRFSELIRLLGENGQTIPLDGPYSDEATVGGMVAANISGSRRRLYGTARDMVIGMKFATLDGKLVQSGGMVVKNVAGLDMAKLMIGSFGTLAAVASVNFKLAPSPPVSRTMLFFFEDAAGAGAARDRALRSPINPVAVDLLNPSLAARLGFRGFVLALMFSGSETVIARSRREAEAIAPGLLLNDREDPRFWQALRDATRQHLEQSASACVARLSTTLKDCVAAVSSTSAPAQAHAGSGVVRAWFEDADAAEAWLGPATERGWKAVIEFANEKAKPNLRLWPRPGPDLEIMKRVKGMFDPEGLLNSGRLYGII